MADNNTVYNDDELEAPSWLDNQFFTQVLKSGNENDISVVTFQISPASAQGDHYASIMFRVLVEYLIDQKKYFKSLIIKTMPEEEGPKKDFIGEESKVFQTEIAMYTKILPKFERVLRETKDETILCAKCIYHTLEPRKIMIFEDLLEQGFQVVRNRDVNQNELQSALEKLAKWQAVSYKVLQEEPDLLYEIRYNLTTAMSNFLEQDFFTDGLTNFIEMLGTVQSLKKYQKYFKKMQGKLIPRWANIMREYRDNFQPDKYYVLCHGDFHRKNVMFKHNKINGNLEDCMLVDFQMSYVGPMTNDFLYAVYLLFGRQERREKIDELIYFYFKVFEDTLKKIGYQGKMPHLLEYRRQLFENRDNDFILLTTFMPVIIAMHKESMDFGEISVDAKKRVSLQYNKEFQQEVKVMLPRMLHLGYFEHLEN